MTEWQFVALCLLFPLAWIVIMGFLIIPVFIFIGTWVYLGTDCAKLAVSQYFQKIKGNSIS